VTGAHENWLLSLGLDVNQSSPSLSSLTPLSEAIGPLDHKFTGIRDAAQMGLRVPYGVLLQVGTDNFEECLILASAVLSHLGRPSIGEAGICIRFGDKFRLPQLPFSVCFVAARSQQLQTECAEQTRHFAKALGYEWEDRFTQSSQHWLAGILSLVAQYIRRHGLATTQALIQEAVDTVTSINSGYGVAYTRHQSTGEDVDVGRYMWGVSGFAFNFLHVGSEHKHWLPSLLIEAPNVYDKLLCAMRTIELYYGDVRFLEFAIVEGGLWILQVSQRREKCGPSGPLRRKVPEAWRGAPLPMASWLSTQSYAHQSTLESGDVAADVFFDAPIAVEYFRASLKEPGAEGRQRRVVVFLRSGIAPPMDDTGGVPFVIAVHNERPIIGRRYRCVDTEIVHLPTLKTIVTICDQGSTICVVGPNSEQSMIYAAACLHR